MQHFFLTMLTITRYVGSFDRATALYQTEIFQQLFDGQAQNFVQKCMVPRG